MHPSSWENGDDHLDMQELRCISKRLVAALENSRNLSQQVERSSHDLTILICDSKRQKTFTQPAGFEPARGDPIGFQVQRLNHSATTAQLWQIVFPGKLLAYKCRCCIEMKKKRLATRLTVDWASIAQWLEHWSCKPGVGSSILPGGCVWDEVFLRSPALCSAGKYCVAPGEARTHNPGIAHTRTVYKYRALTDCATGAYCRFRPKIEY